MRSPRKTIATAQSLYHRFHLFFPRKDHGLNVRVQINQCCSRMLELLQEVSLASLYVSTKMHDTLKKPREILMASYAVRFPELAAKSKLGGEIDMDPNVRCSRLLYSMRSRSYILGCATRSTTFTWRGTAASRNDLFQFHVPHAFSIRDQSRSGIQG